MNVGGQAVLEGVMMRAPNAMAVVVRRPSDQHLVVLDQPWRPLWTYASPPVARVLSVITPWPVVRGAVTLIESLLNGFQALSFAADELEKDQLNQGSTVKSYTNTHLFSLGALLSTGASGAPGSGKQLPLGQLLMSLGFAIGLFVGLPHALAWLITWLTGGYWDVDSFVFHLLDGGIKLGLFIGYVRTIGQIPEVHRVFQYHGAEHKVVNTYECGRPLDLDEVRLQGTFHARCGTSFVLLVLVMSVAFFSVVLPLVPPISSHPLLNHLALMLIKIPLMLPLGGLAYELNRWAAQNPGHGMVQVLVSPGRWMQKLTTQMPDDAQLEVALAAMKVVLKRQSTVGHRGTAVRTEYPDLEALESTLSDSFLQYPSGTDKI